MVGIYPITVEDIRKFSTDTDATDEDLVNSFHHVKSRMEAAQYYLHTQLMFQEDEIPIKTLKMSSRIESKVMWIDIGELNVRRLFHRMKNLRNPTVQLINYIPAELWEKMKKLDTVLKAERNVKSNFRYIVKLGKNDLTLLTKTLNETYWEEVENSRYIGSTETQTQTDSSRKRKQSPQTKPNPKRTLSNI